MCVSNPSGSVSSDMRGGRTFGANRRGLERMFQGGRRGSSHGGDVRDDLLQLGLREHALVPGAQLVAPGRLLLRRVAVQDVVLAREGRARPDVDGGEAAHLNGGKGRRASEKATNAQRVR
eukprot:1454046-Pyramimonas_sp.AAC.2